GAVSPRVCSRWRAPGVEPPVSTHGSLTRPRARPRLRLSRAAPPESPHRFSPIQESIPALQLLLAGVYRGARLPPSAVRGQALRPALVAFMRQTTGGSVSRANTR